MSGTISPETTLTSARIVERYAHFFDKPEVRLRFFNKTLAKQVSTCEKLSESLSRFKFIRKTRAYSLVLDCWLYVLIIREVNQFSRSETGGASQFWRINKVPFGSLLLFYAYKVRFLLGALGLAVVAVCAIGIYSLVARAFHRSEVIVVQQSLRGSATTTDASIAKLLPDYKPVKVWLVEQKDNFERYSNGLRILRDYETTNHRRGYSIFNPAGEKITPELSHDPVGIVYHTSESDILPFVSENNDSIESHTRGLLSYVKTHKSYNYVIDRFGQVYRIVSDDQAADHAGNSIWIDRRGVYVGLNESFLGVCFETNSAASAGDEQLTEAQILAGRLLTQILRGRHNIDDADCVTHGLVSVNPENMLVSYHHDWVRNFPFEAMGLSDKYRVATASIGVYGFTYDDEIAKYAGGEIWPGAKLAAATFERRAEEAQVDVWQMRRQMRDLYREQLAQQNRERRLSAEGNQGTPADAATARTLRDSGDGPQNNEE